MHFIYKNSKDGFFFENFKSKIFNAGPTLILLRDIKDTLIGGFTTKDWTGSGNYVDDPHAFVFNLHAKYTPNDSTKAIFTHPNGFQFGNEVLSLSGADRETLNQQNKGTCKVE